MLSCSAESSTASRAAEVAEPAQNLACSGALQRPSVAQQQAAVAGPSSAQQQLHTPSAPHGDSVAAGVCMTQLLHQPRGHNTLAQTYGPISPAYQGGRVYNGGGVASHAAVPALPMQAEFGFGAQTISFPTNTFAVAAANPGYGIVDWQRPRQAYEYTQHPRAPQYHQQAYPMAQQQFAAQQPTATFPAPGRHPQPQNSWEQQQWGYQYPHTGTYQ